MDKFTKDVKKWLEKRYSIGWLDKNKYYAHAPIYGYKGYSEVGQLHKIALKFGILKIINRLNFKSCIDLGGAEGFLTYLIKEIFNIEQVFNSEISLEANERTRELFDIKSICFDVTNIPLKNNSIDLVICSEVIEHLNFPIQAILEMERIAKKYLIITTNEICYNNYQRNLRLLLREYDKIHSDKNYFLKKDFVEILGNNLLFFNQLYEHEKPLDLLEMKNLNINDIKYHILKLTEKEEFINGAKGIIVLKDKTNTYIKNNQRFKNLYEILNNMLSFKKDEEWNPINYDNNFDKNMLEILCCPYCKSDLDFLNNLLKCSKCKINFEIKSGIPILLSDKINIGNSLKVILSKNKGISLNRIDKILDLNYLFNKKPITNKIFRLILKIFLVFNVIYHMPQGIYFKASFLFIKIYKRFKNFILGIYRLLTGKLRKEHMRVKN